MACSVSSLDNFFLLAMGGMVFLMQLGFAFLEAGSISKKNVTNIMFKNLMDAMFGAIVWWAVGFAFAFGYEERFGGGEDFIGRIGFFGRDIEDCDLGFFFFQYTFAITASTIVSGAMAERTQLSAFFVYCTVLSGFIYPAVVYWVWSGNAWLFEGEDGVGYRDFAGSGVVHVTGGAAALVGAWLLGPRASRVKEGKFLPAVGHSTPFVALGGFILAFGFLGFNGGSQLAIDDTDGTNGGVVSLAFVNTILAGAGGATTNVCLDFVLRKTTKAEHISLTGAVNAMLAGMVAICAPVDVVRPWAALVIGVIACFSFRLWDALLFKLRIDDAINAVPVHLGAGIWGVLSRPIFEHQVGIVYVFGETAWEQFAWNLAGVITIFVWAAGTSFLLFGGLKMAGRLRVTEDTEASGLDETEHGEKAYFPDFTPTAEKPSIQTMAV